MKKHKKKKKLRKRLHKVKMSDFPIPTTKAFKSKRRKSRQQKKIDLKKDQESA
jgi:hypothetical protein